MRWLALARLQVHAPQETSPLLRAHAWSPKHTVRTAPQRPTRTHSRTADDPTPPTANHTVADQCRTCAAARTALQRELLHERRRDSSAAAGAHAHLYAMRTCSARLRPRIDCATSAPSPGLGAPLPTSAPGLGPPLPTSAPGLGSPLSPSAPGLGLDPCHICAGTRAAGWLRCAAGPPRRRCSAPSGSSAEKRCVAFGKKDATDPDQSANLKGHAGGQLVLRVVLSTSRAIEGPVGSTS